MEFKPEYTREGSGALRLVQMMRALGYNRGGDIYTATVTSEYPDFKIRIDGQSIDIPSQGLICSEFLLPRAETVKIDGVETTIEYPNLLTIGTRVLVYEQSHGQLVFVLCKYK